MERYEKYKDSGVEWMGEIPEGWEVKRMKYLTTYFKGFAFKSIDFKKFGIPVVKASNLKKKIVVNILVILHLTIKKWSSKKLD